MSGTSTPSSRMHWENSGTVLELLLVLLADVAEALRRNSLHGPSSAS